MAGHWSLGRWGLGVLLAAMLPVVTAGCAGLLGSEGAAESAHAVFVVRPGCPYLIARTPGEGYAVLAPRSDYAPRRGDLLVGNLRRGGLALGIVPFGTNDLSGSEPFEVVQYGLTLAEAQEVYYARCPLDAASAFID